MSAGAFDDLSKHVLRPTSEELRDTHVLFLARHAKDSSPERQIQYGYPVIYHAAILNTLRELGLKVTPECDLEVLLGPLNYDYIYSIHHHATFEGHEVLAPSIAAYRGIPFLGGPAPTRALGEDKVIAKMIAASLGVEVAEHRILDPHAPGMADFALPGRWILKPRGGVASDAILRIDDEAGWRDALAEAAHPRHEGRDFIAEAFVPGLNLTVPFVEGLPQVFPVFEERGESTDNILTVEGKEGRNADYASQPYFGPGAAEAAAAAARLATALAPFDYARCDFRFDPATNRLVFLEFNLACNLAPAAVVPRAAKLHGITYQALIGHIFTHSLRRQRLELTA